MMDNLFLQRRKSYIRQGEIYFWTATINSWRQLLHSEKFKNVVVQSLNHLIIKRKIDVFGFVIMPNHIHLIWRIIEANGKETSQASFLKFTAHQFKKLLIEEGENKVSLYRVKANNKDYEFWQRDSLAIHLYSKDVAFQKLDYIHNNPLAEHWNLANSPEKYFYSSASFYLNNTSSVILLKDLREEF